MKAALHINLPQIFGSNLFQKLPRLTRYMSIVRLVTQAFVARPEAKRFLMTATRDHSHRSAVWDEGHGLSPQYNWINEAVDVSNSPSASQDHVTIIMF